jgi:hypothetical protein
MSRSLQNRVRRLLRDSDSGECIPCTVTLRYHFGEPKPPIAPDAPRCPNCGEVHPLYEVVVVNHEQAQAVLAEGAS